MVLIRFLIGVLIACIIAIALVPLMVLLDLRDGGTGWGLCTDGFGRCRTSYFAGLELLAALMAAILVLVLAIGGLVRLMRYLRERSPRPSSG